MFERECLSSQKLLGYIRQLSHSFGGVRSPFEANGMRALFRERNFKECIRLIKLAFNLPMTLRIGYLKEKMMARNILHGNEITYCPDFFCPNIPAGELLRGSHCEPAREPAFTRIPGSMPLLGNRFFENITVTTYLRRWILEAPFETFAFAVGHQMAHIVLFASNDRLRFSEIATDLLVMISGFSEIARIGRKTPNERLGYLNDYQFCEVYREIIRLGR
jgi:hypothetical protein